MKPGVVLTVSWRSVPVDGRLRQCRALLHGAGPGDAPLSLRTAWDARGRRALLHLYGAPGQTIVPPRGCVVVRRGTVPLRTAAWTYPLYHSVMTCLVGLRPAAALGVGWRASAVGAYLDGMGLDDEAKLRVLQEALGGTRGKTAPMREPARAGPSAGDRLLRGALSSSDPRACAGLLHRLRELGHLAHRADYVSRGPGAAAVLAELLVRPLMELWTTPPGAAAALIRSARARPDPVRSRRRANPSPGDLLERVSEARAFRAGVIDPLEQEALSS